MPNEINAAPSKAGNPKPGPARSFPLWPFVLLPVLLTAIVYSSLANNGFVNWDDGETITDNLPIQKLNTDSLKWMLTSYHTGNWIPLTWLSLSVDCLLGGLNPQIYHWNNLLLHLLNVALVFLLSRKLFSSIPGRDSLVNLSSPRPWILPASLMTATLFGIHPIHVESVAWASERKDVLYGFFYLLSLLAYSGYSMGPERPKKKLIYCFAFYVMSILSKPMAVSLPWVLLLLDAWPFRRLIAGWKEALREKVPFFIVALAAGWISVFSQMKSEAAPELQKLPLDFRVMNAFHSLAFYIQKMAWPFSFSPIYPIDLKGEPFSPGNVLCFLGAVFVSLAALFSRKSKPYVAVAWLYYLATIAPVLGIIQVGSQAAADRYSYLPTLGLIMLFSAWVAYVTVGRKFLLTVFLAGLTLFLGCRSFQQVEVWKNSISLWENATRVVPNSEIGYWYLGFAYRDVGKPQEALEAFDRSIALNSNLAVTHYGRGLALSDMERPGEAIQEFQKSIALDPAYAQPHINLSVVYQRLQRFDDAVHEGESAVQLAPQSAQAYNNLGVSYGYKGRIPEAADAFQRAVSLEPGNPMYQNNLSAALRMLGK